MKNARRHFALSVLTTLLIFFLPAVMVYVVDPFQVFHSLWIRKDAGFDASDRYQNAGLINSWLADPSKKIDTVILGSSLSQNFPVAKMQNEHCVNALRLTMGGASPKELDALAKRALATGNVKKMIWQMHVSYAEQDPDVVHEQSPLPLFLYDENRWNDWRYLFNNDVVEESLGLIKGKTKGREPLEKLYTWERDEMFTRYATDENIKSLRENLKKADLPITPKPPASVQGMIFPNIEQHIVPVVTSHPQTKFYFFFPPISYYGRAVVGNEEFWKIMMMRKALLNAVDGMENVHVYAFDLEKGIADDITVYQDVEHYRPWVNARMAEDIVQGKNRTTLKDWDAYTSKLVRKVNAYVKAF